MILCDVALATSAVMSRGGGLPLPQREMTWPMWVAAIFLSVWTAWMAKFEVYALRVNGRLDVFLIWADLGFVKLGCDRVRYRTSGPSCYTFQLTSDHAKDLA